MQKRQLKSEKPKLRREISYLFKQTIELYKHESLRVWAAKQDEADRREMNTNLTLSLSERTGREPLNEIERFLVNFEEAHAQQLLSYQKDIECLVEMAADVALREPQLALRMTRLLLCFPRVFPSAHHQNLLFAG
jgi:hypothetical protein